MPSRGITEIQITCSSMHYRYYDNVCLNTFDNARTYYLTLLQRKVFYGTRIKTNYGNRRINEHYNSVILFTVDGVEVHSLSQIPTSLF